MQFHLVLEVHLLTCVPQAYLSAVQTQILGVSTGEMVRDENCERLKISKTLYDMGMKVAAVSVLCQDRRVYDVMEMAGTPCPFLGKIGDQATDEWKILTVFHL